MSWQSSWEPYLKGESVVDGMSVTHPCGIPCDQLIARFGGENPKDFPTFGEEVETSSANEVVAEDRVEEKETKENSQRSDKVQKTDTSEPIIVVSIADVEVDDEGHKTLLV